MVIGILAHVDAGKTTLSESILYTAGSIRQIGRVDKGDAFLDHEPIEKERGITITNKQARFVWQSQPITLVDTPGHIDFSAEMERTLQVLDYAILVISALDGVQGHTLTLWRLLERYQVPVFLFVNKMDQPGVCKESIIANLRERLGAVILIGENEGTESWMEEVAMCEEKLLEHYLDGEMPSHEDVVRLIRTRQLFPCYMGSALHNEGTKQLLDALALYTATTKLQESGESPLKARVYQITRDDKGARLTHLKILAGKLRVKEELLDEKINEIRLYSGESYQTVMQAEAGEICTVLGPSKTFPGQGIGEGISKNKPILKPALRYRMHLPSGCSVHEVMPQLTMLMEENPELSIEWNEVLGELQASLMGQVQTEILTNQIQKRFGIAVTFDQGNIVYQETILRAVEGVGHYEPLRHYAEVHLLIEPGELGSGLVFASDCGEDDFSLNWQRLVLTHLAERPIRGVKIGAPLTDVKFTLVAGRAHIKHTEGGDFRQATYRAIRQGLMEAETVILEPVYHFQLTIPQNAIGRAMTDIERMSGRIIKQATFANGLSNIEGTAPVSTMQNYANEVAAYTHGMGSLFCEVSGYEQCHNEEEIMTQVSYLPDEDLEYPSSSIFCSHGAGVLVPWNEVKSHMHLEAVLTGEKENTQGKHTGVTASKEEMWLAVEEIDRILERTYRANQKGPGTSNHWARYHAKTEPVKIIQNRKPSEPKEEYLLVDGYNIIHAWDELRELIADNMDGARGKLQDILCNYQAIRGCQIIVVFDAYRVKGHDTEMFDYHNIHVVFTKEAETADQYIERFTHDNCKRYHVTVATSDGLEQVIIRGNGSFLLSANDLWDEINRAMEQLREDYL